MVVHIRNSSELKMAYELLMEIQALKPLIGREGSVQGHIRELKKNIRDYFRQQEKKVSVLLSVMMGLRDIRNW